MTGSAPEPEGMEAVRPARRRGVGPFSLRQVALAIGVIVVAAVGLTIATTPLGSVGRGIPVPEPSAYILRSPVPGLTLGDVAPELEAKLDDGSTVQLFDLDGQPIRLADLHGRAVWINFWASWCPPCKAETPVIRQIDETYRDLGLVIIGVEVQETVEDGRRYAATYDLRYRIGADVSARIFRTYRVFALPTQFFIDPNGILRKIVNGPLSVEKASAIVESILPPIPPSPAPS